MPWPSGFFFRGLKLRMESISKFLEVIENIYVVWLTINTNQESASLKSSSILVGNHCDFTWYHARQHLLDSISRASNKYNGYYIYYLFVIYIYIYFCMYIHVRLCIYISCCIFGSHAQQDARFQTVKDDLFPVLDFYESPITKDVSRHTRQPFPLDAPVTHPHLQHTITQFCINAFLHWQHVCEELCTFYKQYITMFSINLCKIMCTA